MSPETIAAYMKQRAALVSRVIELSSCTQWCGYASAIRDLREEIVRIDATVAPKNA